MFNFFYKSAYGNSGDVYNFKFNSIDGGQIELSDYKDKVIVIVNVASRCGYTPQYEDCLLYTSPSPRDLRRSRMPSSA